MKKNIYIFFLVLIIFFGSFSLSFGAYYQQPVDTYFTDNPFSASGSYVLYYTDNSEGNLDFFYNTFSSSTLLKNLTFQIKKSGTQQAIVTLATAGLSCSWDTPTSTVSGFLKLELGSGTCRNNNKRISDLGAFESFKIQGHGDYPPVNGVLYGNNQLTMGQDKWYWWNQTISASTTESGIREPYMLIQELPDTSSSSPVTFYWLVPGSGSTNVSRVQNTFSWFMTPHTGNVIRYWFSTSSDMSAPFFYFSQYVSSTLSTVTSVVPPPFIVLPNIDQNVFARAVLYDQGNEVAYANTAFIVRNGGGVILSSSTPPIIGLEYEDCPSSNFFSSSTLSNLFCNMRNFGAWTINNTIFPHSFSQDLMKNNINNFKTVFPFSLFFGFQNLLESQISSASTSTVNFVLPLGYSGLGSLGSTTVTITSSTVGNVVGASNWSSMREFMTNIIWVGLAGVILFTII